MRTHIRIILISLTSVLAQSCAVLEQSSENKRRESHAVLDNSIKVGIGIKGHEINFTALNTTSDKWAVIQSIPVGSDGVFSREYFAFISGDYAGFFDRSMNDPVEIIAPGDVYVLKIDLRKNYKNLNMEATLPPRIPFKVEYALFDSEAKALDCVKRQKQAGAAFVSFNKFTYAPWGKQ